jgi:hypothetical protein
LVEKFGSDPIQRRVRVQVSWLKVEESVSRGPAVRREKTKSIEKEKELERSLASLASRARAGVLCGRLGRFRPSSVRAVFSFFFLFNCFSFKPL